MSSRYPHRSSLQADPYLFMRSSTYFGAFTTSSFSASSSQASLGPSSLPTNRSFGQPDASSFLAFASGAHSRGSVRSVYSTPFAHVFAPFQAQGSNVQQNNISSICSRLDENDDDEGEENDDSDDDDVGIADNKSGNTGVQVSRK